jgi:hypothetical protein
MGGGRKLHKKELCDLCSSPCIIRMIKSRRMSWVRHVTCMNKCDRNTYRLLVEGQS